MARQVGKYKVKPNYIYPIISIALVLFLVGLFGLIFLHARQIGNYFKEQIEVLVELSNASNETSVFRFQKELAGKVYTKPNSVHFISKEEAAKSFQEDFGEDLTHLGPIPLPDVLSFHVAADYMNMDSLTKIRQDLSQSILVQDVFYPDIIINDISGGILDLMLVTLFLGSIFLLIAIILINNTIRLALYSNRFLIKTMQLVGASRGFIIKPYLIRAIIHGFISSLLAILGLIGCLYFTQKHIPELVAFRDLQLFTLLFIGIALLGLLLSSISTWWGVRKYLKLNLEDLY